MRIFALVLAGAALSAGALAPLPLHAQTSPASASASPEEKERQERLEAMQQEIALALVHHEVPGAAVALVDEKGIVWMGGFGQSDPARGRQATPSTQFAAAAISPLVVGVLAARYAALNSEPRKEGEPPRAPLDEPVDEPALGLSNPFAQTHALTLATLLEQTSGLEDFSPAELLSSNALTPLLADALHLRPHAARWAPGARFSPSRIGIVATASQLERWTKRPFFTIADSELFKPLAMNESTFRPDAATLDAMAVGHAGRRTRPWTEPIEWPALGLITSVEDLAALLQMLLTYGVAETGPARTKAILTPAMLERVGHGHTLNYATLDAPGLGTRIGMGDGHVQIGAEGTFDGGASALIYFPRERKGYAILLNAASPEALEEISASARRLLLRNTSRELFPAPPPTMDDLPRAAGVWRLVSVRLEALRFFDELFNFAIVHAAPSSLAFSPSLSGTRSLAPVGRGAFRGLLDARPTVALIARPDAEELVAPEGTYVRASALATFVRLALTFAALLAMLSSLAFALFWLPRSLFGALKNSPDLRIRFAPALTSFIFFELLALLAFSNQPLGACNLTSLLICVLTLVFPALSLASLLECVRGARAVSSAKSARLVRIHACTVSLLACWLSLELALHGLAGIRTWAI